MHYRLIWILGILIFLLWPVSAQAATCGIINNQPVCIHNLQRSAKNYWEYRVQFKVAGVVQPIEIYDCLHRRKSKFSEPWQQLSTPAIDNLACRLFKP